MTKKSYKKPSMDIIEVKSFFFTCMCTPEPGANTDWDCGTYNPGA